MAKVYLSPSAQEHNEGAVKGYIEETAMNKVGDVVQRELVRNGVTIIRNKSSMTLDQIIADSNKQKVDAHVAIHSNAGGGTGCECWVTNPFIKDKKLADAIYKYMNIITGVKNRGIKYSLGTLGENSKVKAMSCICEVDFHDNAVRCQWILDNIENIGVAISKGVLEYLGIAYKPVQSPTNSVQASATDYSKLYADEKNTRTAAESKATALQNQFNTANDKLTKIKEFVKVI